MIRKKDLLERIDYLDMITQKQTYVIELLYKRLKQSGINFDSRLAELESMWVIEADKVFDKDGHWIKGATDEKQTHSS